MRHADLPAFLNDLASTTTGMLRLIRRLRLGWLYHHRIGVVRGLDPMTEPEMAAVTRRDLDKLTAGLRIPEYLDDIWDLPDRAFSLFDGGRKIGVGIKVTDHTGYGRLYWFKLRDASR
jgi:hypothetical protein